ncbi:putative nucleotide-binding protein [Trypanosoma grayi]|uniref:putative nucleotide-binding protein n=1 Tax=Trypanosoma grayi TaxID=71804 RepID=UPI0004F40F7F|nr:putative nucleotide-binding protein [Trypanosoma grayi]KEG11647.1 putative nucleotide-binding protein [Trypanosoma grayi]
MKSAPPLSCRQGGGAGEIRGVLVSPRPVSAFTRSILESTNSGLSKTNRGSVYIVSSPRPVDFNLPESQEAMSVLQKLLLPIVMKRVLRTRKKKRLPGGRVLREYTADSVVHALRFSNSIMSNWPEEVLRLIGEEVSYFYLEPGEIIVHMKEWYISTGIVILLLGELSERTKDFGSQASLNDQQCERRHTAQAVLCDRVVLCRDASMSCARAHGDADVAVAPARWVWDVLNSYVLRPSAGIVLDTLKMIITPMCEKIVRETYYPMPLLLRRSWLWPLLSSSERIRLARTLEVKALCIGDTLFAEGDRSPYIYFIRRGTVRTLVKKEVILEFEAGAAFGEISVLFDEPRCCHAVATTMCEVYCLHRRSFLRRLRKNQELCKGVIEKALERRRRWLEDGKLRDIMGLATLLGGVPCLSQVTDKVRISLALSAKIHVIPPGKKLFAKGMLCDRLFVIGRGTLLLGNEQDTQSTRSTTEFVGELCLRPHLWPMDVVTCTSVDGWSIPADVIMETLASIHAGVQAVDICRQGIDLFRAQHGPNSIVEENVTPVLPTPPNHISNGTTPRTKRMTVAFRSEEQKLPPPPPPPPPVNNESILEKSEGIVADFDWKAYLFEDKAVSPETNDSEGKPSERRRLEQKIESELSRRSGELLSVPQDQAASALDSDFPGYADEIQQMLVEQVLLLPPERQPAFLRQVNCSKVTLIRDDAPDQMEELSSETTVANDLTLPQYVVPHPVVYTLDGITAFRDGNPLPEHEDTPLISPRTGLDFAATTTHRRSRTPEVGLLPHWQSATYRSVEDMVTLTSRSRPQSGASPRSRQLRPSSGFNFRRTPPRVSSAGGNQRLSRSVSFCSRTSAVATLTGSHASECQSMGAQSTANSWAKPNSIDISQQAKINAAMFQSALDRYVKLDDQSYFQEMVRVCLPRQTEEHWPEEESNTSLQGKDGLVLLLMHVRRCDNLNINSGIKSPIVKVSTDARALIRTPVMEDRVRPVWPIEMASFISFVRRDAEVHFTVCDGKDERHIAYTATMPTSDFRENGGVGLRSLRLLPEDPDGVEQVNENRARIEVCMLAVTASKYSSLQKKLADEDNDDKSSDDVSTVYLQVIGVQGLKHRIEAVITVSVETDRKSKEILRTPKVTPKTRSPSWPGQSSFCTIKSDGIVSFDLYHRDVFLASYDTPVDTLAFSGTGIHVFPLNRAQGEPGEVYGKVLVSILGLKTPSSMEDLSERPAKVLVLHVESFSMMPGLEEEFMPDPFVIVRGPKGEVILRTSLNLGTYDAKWTEEGASCFIMCPSLAGCTATYRLEVYDNNESNKIGTAEMVVTMNGTRRNRMQFSIKGKGTLTVLTHSFPIQELPRAPQSLHRGMESLSCTTSENGHLVLIHVSGCDDLQGTGFDDFQIDPLVTARVGRRRMVVAPLVSGSTAPRWSYPKATFVLPVSPDILSHVTLEVWDTNIELCDVLGVARISIADICQTGTHHFSLQPHKDQEFGRRQNLGTITVKSRFGRVNGEVIAEGSSDFLAGTTHSPGLFDSRLFHAPDNTPDLPVTRVRVHVSNCCAIWTDAAAKSVKVTMSCLQHVLLEVKKTCAKSCSAAWSLEEAQTIVDLRAIYGRSLRITVGCSSKPTDNSFTEVGSALVPFSTLVSSSPEVVAVRSFLLLNTTGERRESLPEGVERSRNASVSVEAPSVTISLLAVDAAHSVGVEGE